LILDGIGVCHIDELAARIASVIHCVSMSAP
jgi:hypothetical protein